MKTFCCVFTCRAPFCLVLSAENSAPFRPHPSHLCLLHLVSTVTTAGPWQNPRMPRLTLRSPDAERRSRCLWWCHLLWLRPLGISQSPPLLITPHPLRPWPHPLPTTLSNPRPLQNGLCPRPFPRGHRCMASQLAALGLNCPWAPPTLTHWAPATSYLTLRPHDWSASTTARPRPPLWPCPLTPPWRRPPRQQLPWRQRQQKTNKVASAQWFNHESENRHLTETVWVRASRARTGI